MRRLTLFSALPLLAMVLASGAPLSAAAPAGGDCATDAPGYPDRWEAEGVTFVGRVLSSGVTPDSFARYQVAVLTAYAGRLGDEVRLVVVCNDTRFAIGARYLFSSSGFTPDDGRIRRVLYNDKTSASWRIRPDDSLELMDHGADFNNVMPYLLRPDRLYEAVRAVAFGEQKVGDCTGGTTHRKSEWHMEVDRRHGDLVVILEVSGVSGWGWMVNLFHDGERFLHVTRSGDNSPFEIVRRTPDTEGSDHIRFRARTEDGEICRGAIES